MSIWSCWYLKGHRHRAAEFKLLGDTVYAATGAPGVTSHWQLATPPSGWWDPRDTWCCLWTALTPPALLLPSITLFMCVLMQPTANTDASSGFDGTVLKHIFRDIRKDRCGRIRRCEWRAVRGSEVIMSGVISSVSFLAKAYIMDVMMFKRTAGKRLHFCECPPLCCQSIFLLWSEDREVKFGILELIQDLMESTADVV